MKSILLTFIITIIFTLTGCGRNVTDQNSDPADSVNKITTLSESPNEGIDLLSNSSNSYFNIPDGVDIQGVIQQDIAGTTEGQIIEIPDCAEVYAVTDSGLYYTKYDYDDEDKDSGIRSGSLYRIPIEKTDHGDRLLIEQSETIFQPEKSIQSIDDIPYITDKYIIYISSGKLLYKLTLTEKTPQLLYEWKDAEKYEEEGYFTLMKDYNNNHLIQKDGLLFLATYTGIFSLDPDNGELHQIHTDEYDNDHSQAAFNGNLYITCGHEVYLYDGTTDQAVCFLDTDAIYQSVDAVNPWSDSDSDTDTNRHCKIKGIYPDGDKIYYNIEANWRKKEKADNGLEKGKMVDQWHRRTLLFSTQNEKNSALQYEKDFSEYWNRTIKHKTDYPDEEEIGSPYESLELGHIHGIQNHTVTFCPNGNVTDTMVEYDLQTGNTRQLSDPEVERWKYELEENGYLFDYDAFFCLPDWDKWAEQHGFEE
ncbi:MAG: hypothetical protein K2K70_10370 [Lachnospiraceae bacterium]|nr:hypothetical protein [Lachnospiraceae bacterium]